MPSLNGWLVPQNKHCFFNSYFQIITYTRLVMKTSFITTAANVKLNEIELVLSLIFCTYLMRPIRSKLCALSYVLIFDLQLSMFTFLRLQI